MAFDKVWDKIHTEREWGRYPKEELVRFVARNYYAVSDRQSTIFLDLGCGAGAHSWYLKREGFQVVALDGSEAAVRRASGMGVVADAMTLPFKDNSFDCVVDIVCIAHNKFEDAKKIVSEIARVLKPDGKVFSMMPTTKCWDGPYKGKGNVIFLMYHQVRQLFGDTFNVEIDWSAFSDKTKMLEHWLIQGTKI